MRLLETSCVYYLHLDFYLLRSFRSSLKHYRTVARSNQERAILYTRQIPESYVVNWKPMNPYVAKPNMGSPSSCNSGG